MSRSQHELTLQQDLQQSIDILNNQMAQFLQALQLLLAQASAAHPAAVIAAQHVSFALSSGTTKPDQLIGFSAWTGHTLYDAGKPNWWVMNLRNLTSRLLKWWDLRRCLNQGVKLWAWPTQPKESQLIKWIEETMTQSPSMTKYPMIK